MTVTVSHFPSVPRDSIRRSLFLCGPPVAESLPYPATYTGTEPLAALMVVSLNLRGGALPEDPVDREGEGFAFMDGTASKTFREATLKFLRERLEDMGVDVTSVTVEGQSLTLDGLSFGNGDGDDDGNDNENENENKNGEDGYEGGNGYGYGSGMNGSELLLNRTDMGPNRLRRNRHRLLTSSSSSSASLDVTVSVMGEHRPPPRTAISRCWWKIP